MITNILLTYAIIHVLYAIIITIVVARLSQDFLYQLAGGGAGLSGRLALGDKVEEYRGALAKRLAFRGPLFMILFIIAVIVIAIFDAISNKPKKP
jgi:hypothetical protein